MAHPKACAYLLGDIQVSGYYFTPLIGVLFTFPSRYLFTIGQIRYLALERDRPRFPQGYSCLVVLRSAGHQVAGFSCTGLSPSVAVLFQVPSTNTAICNLTGKPRQHPTTPITRRCRFGLFRVRSPLLTESRPSCDGLSDFYSSGYLDVSVRQVSV